MIPKTEAQRPAVAPEVGMGATLIVGSDRYPYTVVAVKSEVSCTIQEDKATRLDKRGMSEDQEWYYEPNPEGQKVEARYYPGQACWRASGTHLYMGSRRRYYDFSF